MTFTTTTFAVFLALVFALHWSLRSRTLRNGVLLLASYAFYAWWDWRFAGLMLGASLVDWLAGRLIAATEVPARRRAWLAMSLGTNIAMLGFFKYFNFFSESLSELLTSLGWSVSPLLVTVVLPVGISFYTFQTMSYAIDVYRRVMKPCDDIVDYLAFVSFFPQLVAGPIERATHLLPQISAPRTFDAEAAVDGCSEILWGAFKKMVLADPLGAMVESAYGRPAATGADLAVATVAFAFQIYLDFSAYSHMATGTARLFGISLMRNFAHPYFSQSVAEFWRRWHVSLSTWFRDYVYVPLGGSRAGRLTSARNVMITFLVSGLWHGASWTYVAWGGLNGLALIPATLGWTKPGLRADDIPGGAGRLPSPAIALRILGTFALTCACWVFFRSATIGDAFEVLARITTEAASPKLWRELPAALLGGDRARAFGLLAMLLAIEWATRHLRHPLRLAHWPRPLRWAAWSAVAWSIVLFGTRSGSPFIYFQF